MDRQLTNLDSSSHRGLLRQFELKIITLSWQSLASEIRSAHWHSLGDYVGLARAPHPKRARLSSKGSMRFGVGEEQPYSAIPTSDADNSPPIMHLDVNAQRLAWSGFRLK